MARISYFKRFQAFWNRFVVRIFCQVEVLSLRCLSIQFKLVFGQREVGITILELSLKFRVIYYAASE